MTKIVWPQLKYRYRQCVTWTKTAIDVALTELPDD
ncbi:hypothetical protein R75465_06701 [Paraburkholderia aspalathi]|nr:hypothetical protein R75465_06701 [Paraburkholderia aspalathi]